MEKGALKQEEGSSAGPPVGAEMRDEESGCCASCCRAPTEEEVEERKQAQAQRAAAITQAKQHANLNRPPEGLSMFAPAHVMGSHFGVGMGLYFRMLEWLMILFACTTFLAFPFWICINESVFVNEENKDTPGVGLKVFPEPSLLASTFASIPDRHIDPNNTLTFMLTELGGTWYGPMTKDDFLLWISLLDLVGTVLMICLITYFTYQAAKFEEKVDENTYDATDYAVQVVGLPPDAGVHEVGHFFSKFGEVMDVTIILSMARVLSACAKCATLEHKREQLLTLLSRIDASNAKKALKQLEKTETDLAVALREIYNDMDRAKNKRHMMEQNFFSDPSCVDILLRPFVSTQNWWLAAKHEKKRKQAEEEAVQMAEVSALCGDPTDTIKVDGLEHPEKLGAAAEVRTFTKKSVYDTKAAIVTFNRMNEADNCLKLTPNPGFRGWLYSHTVAQDAQCLRGYCIETSRACDPTDYQFENFSSSKLHRFCRRLGIYVLYLTMLIACGLIVSALESRTRVEFNRESLDLLGDKLKVDIGEAGRYLPQNPPAGSTISQLRSLYEEAMRDAASSSTTPAYSNDLAEQATWDDYCRFALPEVCEDYYRNDLGGGQDADLRITFGKHFQWPSEFQALVYERPLLTSLTKLANAADPRSVKGTDIGLSGCLACYCLGLSRTEEQLGQPTGDWLAISQHHCTPYYAGLNKDSGTAAGISVVIAALNICLKLFVQFLVTHEGHTTRSATERSFCVVAYVLALLNTVLVILLVNARPNAKLTATGERIDEDNIQWLRYIILGGSFDDFSGRWYEYVGVSFIIVLFIQTIFPLLNVFIEVTISMLKRIFVMFSKNATQDDFDIAFDHPQFILQQRVADVMLNVSIALLFSSGMPLCSGVVVLVFAIATFMDRWAVTNLMTVTRYGSQLPRLLLGLLPWMVFLHCGFAIWQHSYFMLQNNDYESTSVFIQLGMERENEARAEAQFGQHIDERNVNARISQPNSFGFLLLVFIMSIWIIYKFLIHGWVVPVIKLCLEGKQEEYKTTGDEAAARRAQHLEKTMSKALDNPFHALHLPGMEPTAPDDEDEIYTFEYMVTNKKLKSTPTYRVPFQPRYAQTFSGLVNSEIWSKMLGPDRYTRLVPVREEEPLCVYRVEVTTGNKWGAGTNSNVLLNIWGTKNGKVESTGLTNLASIHDNFERGNTDVFNLTLPDIGEVNEIEVRSCGKGWSAAWLLDKVTVTDMQRGMTAVFPCYKWLDPKWPESLVVKLKAELVAGHPRKAWPLGGESEDGGIAGEKGGLHSRNNSRDGSRPGSARPGSKEGGRHVQKLVRVRLGWRISPDIILSAAAAPDLDANYEAEAAAEAAAERAKHVVPEARPANFYPAIASAGGAVRYPKVGAPGSVQPTTAPGSSGAKYPTVQAPSTSGAAGGAAAVVASTGTTAPRFPAVTPAEQAMSMPVDGAALPTIPPAGGSVQAPGGGGSASMYPTVPRAGQAYPSVEINPNPSPQGGEGGANPYPRVNPNQGGMSEFYWR